MGVSDANAVYGADARFTHKPISFYQHITLISQTATELWTHTPGYNFQVIGAEVYCMSLAGTTTVDILIGSTTVLTTGLVPVALIDTKASIVATGAEYGDDDDIISFKYTSDGSGVVNAATFQLWIRRRAQDVT